MTAPKTIKCASCGIAVECSPMAHKQKRCDLCQYAHRRAQQNQRYHKNHPTNPARLALSADPPPPPVYEWECQNCAWTAVLAPYEVPSGRCPKCGRSQVAPVRVMAEKGVKL